MQLTGKVLSVDSRNLAESTISDKLPGATTLDVTDASSFPLEGGTVSVEGVLLNYLSADYDADQLALEQPLTVAVPIDSLVEAYPPEPERIALVDLGGNGEASPVVIPHALAPLIEDGVRAPKDQETVYIERREDGSLALLDVIGQPAVLTVEALEAVQTSDGAAPTSSPTPTVIGGIGALSARWTPITNNDPVHYEVHLSTDSAFAPGQGTLVADTTGFSATLRTLPNGTPLVYDVTYWVRVVAYDEDGYADPSTSQGAKLMRVTSADIAAEYVYAGSVSASQLTSGSIASDLLLAGSIKTATEGARVELGAFGLIEYDAAGNPAVLLGTDGQASFRGQVQATSLTVTGGMSLRGTGNEISRSASLTLAVGSTPSSNAPSVVVDYDSTALQENSALAGGTFLSLTPYSLERVGTQWLVTYSDGQSRLFTAAGAYVGTVGATDTTKRATTQLSAATPLYFINTAGRLCRDLDAVNGVERRQLDDPLNSLAGWTTLGAAPTSVGGKALLAVTPPAAVSTQSSGLASVGTYNMQGHDVSVDLVSDVPLHATQKVIVQLYIDASNSAQLEWITDPGNGVPLLQLRIVKAGVTTTGAANVYDPVSMANLGLREDGGLFYVRTRPDASSGWAYQNSLAHTFTKAQLAACTVRLIAQDTGPANVVANSGFETDVAGWTGSGTGYSTVARSTAQKRTGVASMAVTGSRDGDIGATATSTSSAVTDAVPITRGATYTASWWGKTAANVARRMLTRFYWYTNTGAYLSATSVDSGVVAGQASWSQATATAVAPVGAAFMAWRVYMGDMLTGDTFYVDDVSITYAPLAVSADNVRVRWVDATGTVLSFAPGSAIGNDGTNILVVSLSGSTPTLQTIDAGDLVTVISSQQLTGASVTGTLAGVEVGTFDFAGPRVVLKATSAAIFWVYDAATGAYLTNETFPSTAGGAGNSFDWDGSVFVELGSNSRLYKHTALSWSGARTQSWDAAFTWYDGNPTGGVHETTPSPRQSFTMRKRARLTITSPDIPNNGGTDDPDRIGVYLANGTSSTLYQQLVTALGIKTAVLSTALFSGTAAPVVNSFPGATPAQIVSSDGTLAIKADGTVQAASIRATGMHIGRATKSTAQAYTASTSAVVQLNATPQLVGMTWDSVNYGFKITKAGRYLIAASVCYAATPPAAGRIECMVWINGAATALRTAGAPVTTNSYPTAGLDIVRDLAVNDLVQLVSYETCGAYSTHTNATATFLEVAALY